MFRFLRKHTVQCHRNVQNNNVTGSNWERCRIRGAAGIENSDLREQNAGIWVRSESLVADYKEYFISAKAPAGDLFRTGFLMVRFRKNDEFLRAIRIFNDGVCCGKFIANGRHECGNSCWADTAAAQTKNLNKILIIRAHASRNFAGEKIRTSCWGRLRKQRQPSWDHLFFVSFLRFQLEQNSRRIPYRNSCSI
jgi:hypothetical protein